MNLTVIPLENITVTHYSKSQETDQHPKHQSMIPLYVLSYYHVGHSY